MTGVQTCALPISNVTNTKLEEPAKNSKKADFNFYDSENKPCSVNDFLDKPIAILLWNSDSENSLNLIELVEKYYENYSDSVNILVINTNEKNSDIVNIVNNCNFSIPIYYDKDLTAQKNYEFEKLPYLIFIDEYGTVFNTIQEDISEDSFTANLDIIAHNY